ncbi:Phosphonoacetaldehyde reductase [bioreactor metagenome]|uniref:Phosphonoacetaldehyde reductase n=1 Tax=bioreactor metagenome TaxID=1076179 RepID=A0A645H0J0_9ZZZZ
MLDALCQAIESWWSVNSTDESKAYSKKAIKNIKSNWEDYIFKNSDSSAEEIMQAANYAGRAINITATTAAHAMSYKITSLYKFPHGHAVAVCLPEVWKYIHGHIDDCIDQRGRNYLDQTMQQISEEIDFNYFEEMLMKMNIGYPIASSKTDEVELLTKSVNPLRLKNTPVMLNTEVLKEMYRGIVR